MNPAGVSPIAKPGSQRFLMLDLMRGIAALAVLVYHTGNWVGISLPNAYLAVDLFFLLSGFVIAHNYDGKIAKGMSFTDFIVQRLIRLYPCLLLTLLLGVAVFCLRMTRDEGFLDGWRILGAAGFNALFLPTFVQPYGFGSLFPFNGAAWSLTFELVANILYWLTFRRLNGLRLALLILVSFAALAVGVHLVGNMDIGMRTTDFWWGIPRVCLTFFLGVALRRYFYERLSFDLRDVAAPLVLLSLMLVFSLGRFVDAGFVQMGELLAVSIFFPLLLVMVVTATPGPGAAAICKWTGDASYPVYLLQVPFMALVAAVPQLWGMKVSEYFPWAGWVHILGTFFVALIIDRYYELPLRKHFRSRWEGFKKSRGVTRGR